MTASLVDSGFIQSEWQIVLLGLGRMGRCFAHGFHGSSTPVECLHARASDWAFAPRLKRRRLIILSVSDKFIEPTMVRLLRAQALQPRDIVVHLAGAQSLDLLEVAQQAGVLTGVLHPCVAVAAESDPPSLNNLSATFEGDPSAFTIVQSICTRIGLSLFSVSSVDRAMYHAAAALCATGAVALAQASARLLAQAMTLGDDKLAAESVHSHLTSSLLMSAAHNIREQGAERALASPLLRGDTQTVRAHLEAMHAHPPALALYRGALQQVLLTLETQNAVDPSVVATAKKLLSA